MKTVNQFFEDIQSRRLLAIQRQKEQQERIKSAAGDYRQKVKEREEAQKNREIENQQKQKLKDEIRKELESSSN